MLIFLGGCFAMGLYTPLVKLLHRGESMAVMTFWVLVTGSLWLMLFAGGRLPAVAWTAVPLFAWLGVVIWLSSPPSSLFFSPSTPCRISGPPG